MNDNLITMNIGMMRGAQRMPVPEVLTALRLHLPSRMFSYRLIEKHPKISEPTMVVWYKHEYGSNCKTVERVALALEQDCIAMTQTTYNFASLEGPGRKKYGPFDRNKFITKEEAEMYSHPSKPGGMAVPSLKDRVTELEIQYGAMQAELKAAREKAERHPRPAGWMSTAGSATTSTPLPPLRNQPRRPLKAGDKVRAVANYVGKFDGTVEPFIKDKVYTVKGVHYRGQDVYIEELQSSGAWSMLRFELVEQAPKEEETPKPAEPAKEELTKAELTLLARLVGNHVSTEGESVVRAYSLFMKLRRLAGIDMTATTKGFKVNKIGLAIFD
jgi:hypothetical protein